ncbi:OsmC family protein [Pseudonocardia yunnanensis]|uniref:OsmC family protein n=1 Tax=Pseudonocardia yunnanensis TaxID=58107 RepID=A0ABW4F4W4_9PSEU
MTENEMIDPLAVEATIDAVHSDPKIARVTFSVVGEWAGGFRIDSTTGQLRQGAATDVTRTGRFAMSSDEPTSLLGTDTAASPGEYIAQALVGCYTATLVASAAAERIAVRSMTVGVEIDFDVRGFLGLETDAPVGASEVRVQVTLDAPGHGPEELRELIALVESRSPIRDTLVRAVPVATTLQIA